MSKTSFFFIILGFVAHIYLACSSLPPYAETQVIHAKHEIATPKYRQIALSIRSTTAGSIAEGLAALLLLLTITIIWAIYRNPVQTDRPTLRIAHSLHQTSNLSNDASSDISHTSYSFENEPDPLDA